VAVTSGNKPPTPSGGRILERLQTTDESDMKRKTSISHDEAVIRELKADPSFAAEYLNAALEDVEEPQALLVALRRVAKARGGVAKIAKAAGVERESLYRVLSARGNPRLSTLTAVTRALIDAPSSHSPRRVTTKQAPRGELPNGNDS
jgi:probable addiction module antidote protein